MEKLRLINENTLGLEYEPICPRCGFPVEVLDSKVKGKDIIHKTCEVA